MKGGRMQLDTFSSTGFDRGASRAVEAAWLVLSGILVASWLPGSSWRALLLRAFGAQIGEGVVIKPGMRVKFPWRLTVGDYTWIGEDVWIDNLAHVTLADHVCVSQGAYLCTGNHDWSSESFDLILQGINVETGAWIGAKSFVAPGALIRQCAVLTAGSAASGTLDPYTIYGGNKAIAVGSRKIVPANSD